MIESSVITTEFIAGMDGPWKIVSITPVIGVSLPVASSLNVVETASREANKVWSLKGVSGHARYTTRAEKKELISIQSSLGRDDATFAALIPIKKSPQWWELTQDERREIFERKSKHITRSMKYLPAIARKLYHSRDLGEPFDFLTWFEFAPWHEPDFNRLLAELRSSEEWNYVSREIDIRLEKKG